MRNSKAIALLIGPLVGCYAQLENPSISVSHPLCTGNTNCIPGGPGVPLSVTPAGGNTFTVPFGDQPLLKPSSSLGPATLNTSLLMNRATFDMRTAGADFMNVDSVTLRAALQPANPPGSDPCATASNCVTIATYVKSTDGTANQQIVLKGNGSDLVNYINNTSHDLTIQIQATGFAPNTPWNADVSMDMALKARANFP